MNSTIDFYNRNAAEYCEKTKDINMSALYNRFEQYLYEKAQILDIGCGSGRDTKYFMGKGYSVTAIDASENICNWARRYVGKDIKNINVEDIRYYEEFDGIWASASLLHVPKNNMADVLNKCMTALRQGGVLYASWKYGICQHEEDGRKYSNFTCEELEDLLACISGIENRELWITEDLLHRDSRWVNVILTKA